MKFRAAGWALGGLLLLSAPQIARAEDNNPPPAPDNTEKNKDIATTADQQGMSAADTEMTQKIRATIMKDKTMSVYAKNVKIIARNGQVTLEGPVRNDAEKMAIEKAAADVAGATNVTNHLTIAPPK
jgi:osmotically-inducible protein OsmY